MNVGQVRRAEARCKTQVQVIFRPAQAPMNTPLLSDLEVRPGPVLCMYIQQAVDMHVQADPGMLVALSSSDRAEAVGQGANQLGLRRVY